MVPVAVVLAAEVGAGVVAAAAPLVATGGFHCFVLASAGLLPVGLLDAVLVGY